MIVIPKLEIHVVHSCNLTCESCSHYSNQGHKGIVSLAEAERWMQPWSGRIAPQTFSLVGGEPSIHPHLPEFAELSRRLWPTSHLRLVTNGFFLHRHPRLPEVLRDDPNACLYLSIHHDSEEYQNKLKPVLQLIDTWVEQYGIQVKFYQSYQNWTRRYQGFGATMQPYSDGLPRQSWEHCPARHCMQLFEGKLWKCGPLAYLKLQDEKYHLSDAWRPYLAYQPLVADCTDEALAQFAARNEESYCGMCAAQPEKLTLPMPLAA